MNILQRLKAKRQLQKDADTYLLIQQTLGEYFTLAEEELTQEPTFTGFVGCYTEIRKQECPIYYFNSVSYAYDQLPKEYTEVIADNLQDILAKRKDLTLTQLLAEPFVALHFDNYLFVQHLQNRFHMWQENSKQLVRVGPARQ